MRMGLVDLASSLFRSIDRTRSNYELCARRQANSCSLILENLDVMGIKGPEINRYQHK